METNTVPLASLADVRQELRRAARPKGRQAQEEALVEVRRLVAPRTPGGYRRDHLIEYLHAINDAVGALPRRHLVALARDMRLSMAEVYEVASFYHHFDVVDDDVTPAHLTVRVCEGLSCALAGHPDASTLQQLAGPGINVVAAPCVGRCEQAPAVLVGQQAVTHATVEAVAAAMAQTDGRAAGVKDHVGLDAYRAAGGELRAGWQEGGRRARRNHACGTARGR